jgi:hypothetical protein
MEAAMKRASELDALFSAARNGDEPSDADWQRVHARVSQRLALGLGTGAAVFSFSRWAASASMKGWLLAGVFAIGAGATVSWVGVKGNGGAPAASAAAAIPPLPARQVDSNVEVRPATSRSVSIQAPARQREQPGAGLRPRLPAPSTPNTLAQETAALRAAGEALRAGTPARALQLLDGFNHDFPNAVLGQEALATRVSALCAGGRAAEARDLATRFLQRYPRSPVAARVKASCAFAPR